MKLIINTVLFLFIIFLSTPTVVGMVDDDVDISCFYNLAEEEEETNPTVLEVKILPLIQYTFLNFFIFETSKFNVNLNHVLCYNNLAHKIFSPPPNSL
jgi:hypothetical protein